MGIYIENMEMPKEIEPALVIDFCEDLDGKRYARFYHYRYGGLTDWHEVLEIPEPHGRLIDADDMAEDLNFDVENDQRALGQMDFVGEERERIQFDKDCKQNCMWYLSEAPTIIPAGEEKEDTAKRDYEAAADYQQYCEMYEPTYDPDTGAM